MPKFTGGEAWGLTACKTKTFFIVLLEKQSRLSKCQRDGAEEQMNSLRRITI